MIDEPRAGGLASACKFCLLTQIIVRTLCENRLDEPKHQRNLRERGLDFADLDVEFFAASIIVPAKRDRLMAIGEFRSATLAVIFKRLGTEAISVISMRRASRKERNTHGKS